MAEALAGRLAVFFAFSGAWGVGGVFSIRLKTSSREIVGVLGMKRNPLNPVLERNPLEALQIGQIVLAYSELELFVAQCAGLALGNFDQAIRMMFRFIGESARLVTADVFMKPYFKNLNLESEYSDAYTAMRVCISIRNQYAHCHWGGDAPNGGGVYFALLKDSVSDAGGGELNYWFVNTDILLLDDQWDFMKYTADCFTYLIFESRKRRGDPIDHNAIMPPKRGQPNLYNPPLERIPPWLSSDGKQRHLEHFQPRELEPKAEREVAPIWASIREKRYVRQMQIYMKRIAYALRNKSE